MAGWVFWQSVVDNDVNRVRRPARRARRSLLALAALLLLMAVSVPVAGSAPTDVGAPNADGSYTTSATSLGVNTTSGDSKFKDAVIPSRLSAAGIGRVRYPGGSGADGFNWATNSGQVPWTQFMGILAQANAAPLVTVNYGQTTVGSVPGPQAAANWVTNALTQPNYSDSTALWVLGNEGYGAWETDQHPEPHTPQSFATNAAPYMTAMHAADPNVKVGVPLAINRDVAGGSGTWVADPDLWNRTILSQDASGIDWIDFHWYPVFGIPLMSNAQIFATVKKIPGAMQYLQGLVDQYDPGIPISVSESNISQSEIVYNAQPVAALYAAASSLEFLAHGGSSYMWWQVHNTDNMNGDFGFLSDATGSPGPSATTLTADAAPGARNVSVASTSGFHYGHQFTIGAGSATESRKITALPGATTLSASAAAGDSTVKMSKLDTLTTSGATTDYVPFFAPGTPVTIGSGANAETRTVVKVGTAADSGTIAAPAAAGDTNLKITGVGMGGQSIPVFMPVGFAPGETITVGSGAGAETATIESVGDSSSLGTTLVAPAAPGDSTIYVASVTNTSTGIANYAGDAITIDTGGNVEVGKIAYVGSSAGTATTLVTPAAAGDTHVYLASIGGVTVGHKLSVDTGAGQEQATVTAVGTAASTATRLSVASAAGASNVKVASVTGLTVGHTLVVDTGANLETGTIAAVGTAGATGTGVTLTAPLALAHALNASARDAGTGVTVTPLAQGHVAGATARDLGSGIRLAAPLTAAHAAGVATRDAGTGLTLTAPLALDHPMGDSATTAGTGLVLSAPLTFDHPGGDALTSSGVTFTPGLSTAHPNGDALNELGLKEPAADTEMPGYWGFNLAKQMTVPGSHIADLSSPTPTLLAYKSFLAGTSESVMLINTDDSEPETISLTGMPGDDTSTLQTTSYSLETPTLDPRPTSGSTTVGGAAAGIVVPPESIVVLSGSAGDSAPTVALSAPAALSVTHVPDGRAGWNIAPVIVTITQAAAMQGTPSCMLDATSPLVLTAASSANSWTTTVTGDGPHTVSCSTQDAYGNTSQASDTTIEIDTHAPVIAYSGNAGSYGVDQTISIGCAATDPTPGSGLATTTCSDYSVPAYTLALGAHTLTSTATDVAGNTSTASTSFTVTVTIGSLESLVQQFAGAGGETSGLLAKLEAAGSAKNATARDGQLGAFENAVGAQSGKRLTAAQAQLLQALAKALE